jgi:hypothetical protein
LRAVILLPPDADIRRMDDIQISVPVKIRHTKTVGSVRIGAGNNGCFRKGSRSIGVVPPGKIRRAATVASPPDEIHIAVFVQIHGDRTFPILKITRIP